MYFILNRPRRKLVNGIKCYKKNIQCLYYLFLWIYCILISYYKIFIFFCNTDIFSKQVSANEFILYQKLNNSIYEIHQTNRNKTICQKSLFYLESFPLSFRKIINKTFVVKTRGGNFLSNFLITLFPDVMFKILNFKAAI